MPRPRHSTPRPSRNHARQEITQEAARIMADEGVHDFHAAKLKAVQRLNLPARDLPTNLEIDTALGEYLRLFHPERDEILTLLVKTAINTMMLLEKFHPRLVGPVLTGHVTRFTDITLHLTAEGPEDLAFFLDDSGISYEQSKKRLRFGGNRFASFPTYHFTEKNVGIEAVVFSAAAVREIPLNPVDGKPLRRATLHDTRAVLEHNR